MSVVFARSTGKQESCRRVCATNYVMLTWISNVWRLCENRAYYSIKDKLVHLEAHMTYLGSEADEFFICGMRYHVHLCDSLEQSGLHSSLNINRISYNFP